jgi:Amt family ammonium transporter
VLELLAATPPPVSQEQFARLASVVAVCWWTICFALIFFMQAGFQLLEGGSIRAKNVAHVGAKVMTHMGIAIVTFYAVGFAIKNFGWPWCYLLHQSGTGSVLADVKDTAITGYSGWRAGGGGVLPWSFAATPDTYGFSFFGSLVFCITSTAIPGTVFSERFKYRAYVLFAIIYTVVIYPVFGWLVWGGLAGSPLLDPHAGLLTTLDRWFTPALDSALGKQLLDYGMVADGTGTHFYAPYTDYAGSTGVHVLGGVLGAVGAWYVGPRRGKFDKQGRPVAIPAHDVPMAVFGALLLAFCWFGFNGGSVVANYFGNKALGEGAGARSLYVADYLFSDIWWVTVVTAMSAAGGVLGSLVVGKHVFGKPDPLVIANGLLGALVAVCAGVGFMPPWAGFFVGLLAGAQFPYTLRFVEHRLKLDDAIGTIACHAMSGTVGGLFAGVYGQLFWWGLLPTSWVHPGGSMASGTFIPTLAVQVVGVVFLFAWALPVGWLTFKVIDKLVGCRVSAEDEYTGLDLAEHGIEAYPKAPTEL